MTYRIPVNRIDDDKAEIEIYGVIGESFFSQSVTAAQFVKDLRGLGKVEAVDVRINSPGGSVPDGIAIFNALRRKRAAINVHIDAIAYSAASFIAMAGDTINMSESAKMLIHDPFAFVVDGTADELRTAADALDKWKDTIVDIYSSRTGISAEEVSDLMANDTFMSADEAKDLGFVDNVTDGLEVAAVFDVPEFLQLPADALQQIKRPTSGRRSAVNFPKPLRENIAMSETTQAAQSTEESAATIQEIRAKYPKADDSFVLAQIEAKATMPQVAEAWAAALEEKLQAVEQTAAEEIEKAKAEVKKTGNPSLGGVGDGTHDKTGRGESIHRWEEEVRAEWDRQLARGKNALDAKREAVRIVNRNFPGLVDKCVEEHPKNQRAAG